MNDILSETAKSFRIIRPRFKGNYKPIVNYTKKQMGCIYLPLVENEKDVYTALFNLFGPIGAKKSFYRYYFPKRFFWTSTLYPKPRVMKMIDEQSKRNKVKAMIPGFRGIPRNKILDTRNLIVDYTDIIPLIIPKERQLMVKSNVIDYVDKIYPEIICYTLFKNNKHDKNNDIEENESTEDLKYDLSEPNANLKVPFYDMSDEEWHELLGLSEQSLEDFTEKLFGKTKLFGMGGPAFGLDQYGFDKFIISIPINLMIHKYFNIPFLTGKLEMLRNIRINPDLVYQLSFLRLIYKVYEAYYNNNYSSDFIGELARHNITFHFYANNGTGFVINMKELKNSMHFKPERFIRMFINRLQLLTMCNSGTITDKDLDTIEIEQDKSEFEKTDNAINKNLSTKNAKKELEDDLIPIIENDLAIQTLINSKIKEKSDIEETNVISNPDDVDTTVYHEDHMIPTRQSVIDSQKAVKELNDITNKFSAKKTVIKTETEGEVDLEFTDADFEEIFKNEEYDENDSDDIIEEDTSDSNIVEDIVKGNTSDELIDEENKSEFSDDIDQFTDSFNSEDELIDEESDETEDYVEIKPSKNKKGPINLAPYVPITISRTPAEEKRLNLLKEKYKSLSIDGKPISDIIGNSANIQIDDTISTGTKHPITNDPNVVKMNMMNFQKSYVKNNYQSDIINCVRSLSVNKEVPFYMTKVDVEDTSDQFNSKLTYSFVLEDEFKNKHNLKFDVPKIEENGLMMISGNPKYLNKQLIRKPIVKIAPDKVYVTTELNSYQVFRKGLFLNKGAEVIRKLFNDYLPEHHNDVIKIEHGNCEADNTSYITTLEYDSLAKNYFFININEESDYGEHIEIFFSQKAIREKIKEHQINTGYEGDIPDNILPIAINYTKHIMYSIDMSKNNSINSSIVTILNDALHDEEMLQFIKTIKTPKRRIYTGIEIQSFKVPLIVFLCFLFGWDRVVSYFPENEIEFSKEKLTNTNKLAIKFYDGYLYYNQYPINGAIFFNGLSDMETENYLFKDLNNPNLFIEYAYKKFKTRNVVKGWVTCKESMLDFKTLQILEALKLPTDFLEIFLYCNDLLTDNQVKGESDISNYRIRSNEIVIECLYKVLNDQYTLYKKKSGKRVSMTIPQNAVLSKVYKTDILKNYDCISPIGEIREFGSTTFKGPGGTKLEQAFTQEKRAFDETYFGVFGISTPDNSNAGVTKELTINTKIENTLGFIGKQDRKDYSLNDIATIAEALTPFVNAMDDPSRIAFVSTQNAHVGGLPNASLPIVRTGVEKTIQFQTSEKFARLAKQDGVISHVDELGKKVFVTYKDGSKEVIDYNNKMLKNSDSFNEAEYNIFVKEGMKIKKGDTIVADSRFFKVDPITKELVYAQARNGLIAIMEGGYTEDDSDLITETFSKKLTMNFTKRKQITIKAKDTIIDYKKVGDHVELGDPIFIFDDSGSFADDDEEDFDSSIFDELFAELDNDTVAQMIHQTPKANLSGTIKDMRVYWTVPLDKMSKSVASFVRSYINKIKKEITEEESFTGKPSAKRQLIEVSNTRAGQDRINGAQLDQNGGILIEYFIGHDDEMSVGDKISLNSSLKTVNSYVVDKEHEPYTESGKKLDGIFSWISCQARMINSWVMNGFLGKILYDYSKRWAKDFLTEIGEEVPKSERDVE